VNLFRRKKKNGGSPTGVERRDPANAAKRQEIDALKSQEDSAQRMNAQYQLGSAQARTRELNRRIETLRNVARLSEKRRPQSP